MKNLLFPTAVILALLSSCTQQRYATSGSAYENDEVYYQEGDTYISDFALVDDETDPNAQPDDYVNPDNIDQAEEEYYDGTETSDGNATYDDGSVVNNYYGDVYQSPYGGTYWGNNYYGNPYSNGGTLVWDPIWGWRLRYSFGWGWGNSYYSGWNSPYYGNGWCWNDPWGYNNGWGWNNYGYYNPYGWNNGYCNNSWGYGYNGWYGSNYYVNNNYYGGGNWNDNDNGGSGIVYGPRPSVSVGSSVNSSYDNGNLRPLAYAKPAIVTEGNNLTALEPAVIPSNNMLVGSGESKNNVAMVGSELEQKPVAAISPSITKPTATVTLNNNAENVGSEHTTIEKIPVGWGNAIETTEKKPIVSATGGGDMTNTGDGNWPEKKPYSQNTKPAESTESANTVTASKTDNDYYTLPKPKAGNKPSKPTYVNGGNSESSANKPVTKPASSTSPNSNDARTNNSTLPAKNNTTAEPAKQNSAPSYERENVKPQSNTSTGRDERPVTKPTNTSGGSTTKPAERNPDPKPSYTPSPSPTPKPSNSGGNSGGSVSPGRSSSSGGSGGRSSGGSSTSSGSSSGGRSGGGSSGGSSSGGRKK